MEAENARLHVQIKEVEVTERKEKEDLSLRYETKIADLRRALDALTRDKNKYVFAFYIIFYLYVLG